MACHGIGVEAFRDEAVHEPGALAHAGQDAAAEGRHENLTASEGAAEPAAEIPDGDFADPLRAGWHAGGDACLPLNRGDGDLVAEEKASPMALATGSAFAPVTAAGTPIAPGKMVLPRFGASTTTTSASDGASGATIWKFT